MFGNTCLLKTVLFCISMKFVVDTCYCKQYLNRSNDKPFKGSGPKAISF